MIRKLVLLFRYAGFLIRVRYDDKWGFPYDWTIEGITPETKAIINFIKRRKPIYRVKKRIIRVGKIRYINNRNKRLYDHTSERNARGEYGSLQRAKEEVNNLLKIFKE